MPSLGSRFLSATALIRWRALLPKLPIVVCAFFAMPDRAQAHFDNKTEWVGHKRQICYRLEKGHVDPSTGQIVDPDIGDDILWRKWIGEAVKLWNDQTQNIGWSFHECAEGEKT